MEKRFCPVIGRMVYVEKNHTQKKDIQKHTELLTVPCACIQKDGVCSCYFSGCCVI